MLRHTGEKFGDQYLTSPTQSSASHHYNGTIDYARILGAIGIVWFHMHLWGGWFTHAALPMFVILLIYFGHNRPLHERARRLMTPWLLWSAIYLTAKLAEVALTSATLADEFHLWMLLVGPSVHLWFLPFSLGFLALCQIMSRIAWIIAIPASVLAIVIMNSYHPPIPFAQWLFVLPSAFIGLFLAHEGRLYWLIGATLLGCGGAIVAGFPEVAGPTLIAAAIVFAIQLSPVQFASTKLSRRLSEMALPLYLIHPLIISISTRINVIDTPEKSFVFVIVVSFLAILAMEKITSFAKSRRIAQAG